MPTRNGRHGMAFTRYGQLNMRNARHADDPRRIRRISAGDQVLDRADGARDFAHDLLRHEQRRLVDDDRQRGAVLRFPFEVIQLFAQLGDEPPLRRLPGEGPQGQVAVGEAG